MTSVRGIPCFVTGVWRRGGTGLGWIVREGTVETRASKRRKLDE